MPNGLIIMHWDERMGAEIIATHPKGTRIEERTLMQIYAQHEYSGDAGFISLSVGTLNLTSYYTGRDTKVYNILLMDIDEDSFEYEEILIDVGRQVLETMSNRETLNALLPNYFQRIVAFPTLTKEQKLALFMQNDVKRMILERFRNEVAITRSEMEIWIKDKYKKAVSIDLDGILDRMIKLGLIKYSSVKGSASDMIFFVQDLMALRHPPGELVKDPTSHHLPRSLKKAYIEQVKEFFKDYKYNSDDNMKIMNEILLDQQCYEVLKLIRGAIVTRDDLEKLKKKGVDDVDHVLRMMWENQIITVLQDSGGTEYYGLTSDFYLNTFYPAYNVNTIVKQYQTKQQDDKILLQALDIMEEEYWIQVGGKEKRKTSIKEQAQAKA